MNLEQMFLVNLDDMGFFQTAAQVHSYLLILHATMSDTFFHNPSLF